jgi:4-amino-4-deoxy-L-arabinose transferase-like glycosyltransferase
MTVLARLRQRLPDPRTCAILAALVAVAALLDFLFYTGFFASDDASYLKAARQIAQLGTDVPGFHWRDSIATTRLGITVPDGLAYWLTGGSIAAIAWFHTTYHLALVLLAYAIGREVSDVRDVRAGLIAAALVATSPVLYLFAGAVLPDKATAGWLAVLLLLLLRARRAGPLSLRESARRYLAAGFVLGVAYGCKETALIMAVPCAAIIIANAPRLRSTVWIRDGAFLAAGLIAFVLLEALLLRWFTHEWLSRVGAVQDSGDILAQRMSKQGTDPLSRFHYLWKRELSHLLPVTGLLLTAAALAFPLMRRRNLALLVFFWWPVLYMTIGTTNFSEYRPSSIQNRYYAIAVVPAAVIAAIVLGVLLDRWEAWAKRPPWAGRRWASVALVALISVVSMYEARHDVWFGGTAYGSEDARGFVLAYETTREQYPQYPVILNSRYRQRMTPLFFPGGPDPTPAGPPFLLLSPLGEELPEGITDVDLVHLTGVHVRTLDIRFPPRWRMDILVDDLYRMMGTSPRPPVPTSGRGAAVIQLVTVPTGAEPPSFGRIPMFALSGDLAIRNVEGGNLAAWQGNGAFYLQLHDAASFKEAPRSPAAQLVTPAAKVHVDVDLRLVHARRAHVDVYLFGYDGDGGRVDSRQKVVLEADATTTVASADLESPTPLTAIRVRVKVRPRGDGGVLYVGNPRVTAAAP